VYDDEDTERGAEPKENEAILSVRVVRIVEQERILVAEHTLRLTEADNRAS
jgi:hypothetical protein